MIAAQWEYIGEGGKHAIFAFVNCDATSSTDNTLFHNKVLRIPKELFRIKDHCVSINVDMKLGDPKKVPPKRIKESYNRQDFQLFFMKALFCMEEQGYPHVHCTYLDEPVKVEFVCKVPSNDEGLEAGCDDDDDEGHHNNLEEEAALSKTFLTDLRAHALQSGKIPPSRTKDWISKENDTPNYPLKLQGYILPNYRHQDGKKKVLSIELKPKAGYVASSPLVHPKHRIKYTRSRFQILQQLARDGVTKKGWFHHSDDDSKDYKMSTYDPLDLFPINYHRHAKRMNEDSSRENRTRRAVQSLFKNPQNNLKVFYGHNMLYGNAHTKHHADGNSLSYQKACQLQHEESAMEALESFFGIEAISVNDGEIRSNLSFLENKLQDILSDILIQDRFLKCLQNYQRGLDLLDVDGAILVYKRLVSLMKDTSKGEILAEELIENTNIDVRKKTEASDPKGAASVEDEIRRKLLSGILFYDLFDDSRKDFGNHSGIANLAQMFQRPGNLSTATNDEEYQRMKEIVDNLEISECVKLLQMWLISLSLNDISFFVIISTGEESEKGRMPKKTILTRCGRRVTYEIKVADYDHKPAKKLRNREKTESVMAHFNSNELHV